MGRFHPDIGGQQQGFEFIEKILVDLLAAEQQGSQTIGEVVSGSGKTLLKAGEEALFLFPDG